MVRCHGCGRRRQTSPNPLFEQLRQCDWNTPLHEAARYLKCGGCGAKNAQIVIPRAPQQQRQLRLVPKEPEKPWERFDAHMKQYGGRR